MYKWGWVRLDLVEVYVWVIRRNNRESFGRDSCRLRVLNKWIWNNCTILLMIKLGLYLNVFIILSLFLLILILWYILFSLISWYLNCIIIIKILADNLLILIKSIHISSRVSSFTTYILLINRLIGLNNILQRWNISWITLFLLWSINYKE